ncbi:hypothetical protein AB4Y43_17160 [Paraburkholderia sp. BR10872]|uniref:hypothetical protein n=1 Tax=Paraburkholderia sp. BR10872 TaxID=3236989 RepID=UPI0034D1E404
MSIRSLDGNRTQVAFFHIVDSKGAALGWLGFCERIAEAMLPAILHPGGLDEAERRSRADPPAVVGYYNGDLFVPVSWLRHAMTVEWDLDVADLMKMAAEQAWRASHATSRRT